MQRLERHLGRRVISGFLVLIPLLVTVLILRFIFYYVDGIFRGEGGFFTPLIRDTPLDFQGVGVIFALIVLYVVGLLVSARAGKRAIDWQSAILSRIPVVKSIYGLTKQAADALSAPMGHEFSRVVFLEWPRSGVMAMGLVTGHCHFPGEDKSMLVVYIPTAPNPTSGMMAFVSETDILETDISVEDAMKVVFSGGIVLPEGMQIKGPPRLSRPPDV